MKFQMQTDDKVYSFLNKEAKKRGVSIQELIRTVVIPDFLAKHPELLEN